MEAACDLKVVREPPDSPLAVELLGRYYAELNSRFPDGFQAERTVQAPPAELVGPHGAFLVVYVSGRAVGCGALRTLQSGVGEIKRMWIDPAVRGRGVGRRLLESLERAATKMGCKLVRLDTSSHLPEAISLYSSSGYREIPAYNDNLYAAHWFEKAL